MKTKANIGEINSTCVDINVCFFVCCIWLISWHRVEAIVDDLIMSINVWINSMILLVKVCFDISVSNPWVGNSSFLMVVECDYQMSTVFFMYKAYCFTFISLYRNPIWIAWVSCNCLSRKLLSIIREVNSCFIDYKIFFIMFCIWIVSSSCIFTVWDWMIRSIKLWGNIAIGWFSMMFLQEHSRLLTLLREYCKDSNKC